MISKRLVIAGVVAAAVAGTPAYAGTIFSGVGFEDGPAGATVQSGQAGATVQSTLDGHVGRAMTDYGVNRIYSAGPQTDGPAGDNAVSSVWAETFTAQGSGMVRISMAFTIDGMADFDPAAEAPEFNHYVQILRGAWDFELGDDFGDLNATMSGTQVQGNSSYAGATSMQLAFGENIVTEFHGENAQGQSLDRSVERFGNTVVITSATEGGIQQQRFLSDRLIVTNNGIPSPPIFYSQVPALAASYQNLLAANPVLARGALCNDGDTYEFNCGSSEYEPWTMTLEFDIAAGSQFTVFSALSAEGVSGTLDFFNTSRLTSLTATGGTLASTNAQFQSDGNGGYGFVPAVTGAVPEPATWAMMIAGFGMVGGSLRRRRTTFAFA